MPEQAGQPETPAIVETKAESREYHPSPRAKAHIILGNFSNSIPKLDQDSLHHLTLVSNNSLQAIEAHHQKLRKEDNERVLLTLESTLQKDKHLQDAIRIKIADRDKKGIESVSDKEVLHYYHMAEWANLETSKAINKLITKAGDAEKSIEAAQALHDIHIEVGSPPRSIRDSLFNPDTGKVGKFYEEFCLPGKNTSKLLADKLTVEQMYLLQPFLTDVLGGETAFHALVALKESMNILQDEASKDQLVRSYSVGVGKTVEDDKVLDFYREGLQLAKSMPVQPEEKTKEQATTTPQTQIPATSPLQPQPLVYQPPSSPESTAVAQPTSLGGVIQGHMETLGSAVVLAMNDLAKTQVEKINRYLVEGRSYDQSGDLNLRSALFEYRKIGIEYLPSYNVTSPDWINPIFTDTPSNDISNIPGQINQIFTNVDRALQEQPFPFNGDINIQFSPQILQETFFEPGYPPFTIERDLLSIDTTLHPNMQVKREGTPRFNRERTGEDLERINSKITDPSWRAVGITINGNAINIVFHHQDKSPTSPDQQSAETTTVDRQEQAELHKIQLRYPVGKQLNTLSGKRVVIGYTTFNGTAYVLFKDMDENGNGKGVDRYYTPDEIDNLDGKFLPLNIQTFDETTLPKGTTYVQRGNTYRIEDYDSNTVTYSYTSGGSSPVGVPPGIARFYHSKISKREFFKKFKERVENRDMEGLRISAIEAPKQNSPLP